MGDRANVHVKANNLDNGVFLYTQFGGKHLPHKLHAALSRKRRWGNTPYLTRIIFDTMVSDQARGYGVSAFAIDGNDRILWVDCSRQTVSCNHNTWTFSDYVKLETDQLDKVWSGEL